MDAAINELMADLDSRHWWFLARRRIVRSLLEQHGAPRGGDVLEVSCGAGGNLAMFAEFGRLSACEYEEGMRRTAARRSGIDVLFGELPHGLPYPPESFDLIAATDVIEHIEDDAGSVRAIAALLRPGGVFLMTVPAYRFLWSDHDEINHHKRRYLKREVKALLGNAGLEIVRASYFNTLLFPVVLGVRFLGTLTGRKATDDLAIPPAPVNGALAAVMGSERHLLRLVDLPFGVSVAALARKPET